MNSLLLFKSHQERKCFAIYSYQNHNWVSKKEKPDTLQFHMFQISSSSRSHRLHVSQSNSILLLLRKTKSSSCKRLWPILISVRQSLMDFWVSKITKMSWTGCCICAFCSHSLQWLYICLAIDESTDFQHTLSDVHTKPCIRFESIVLTTLLWIKRLLYISHCCSAIQKGKFCIHHAEEWIWTKEETGMHSAHSQPQVDDKSS